MTVLVTGMHRSGTSAVARIVVGLDFSMGDGPMMPAALDNPRGFYERVDVSEFNEGWLERLGGSWWAPPAVPSHVFDQVGDEELAAQRASLRLFDEPRWVVKDPRISLLMPLWNRLALARVPSIICVRDPIAIADSLQLRNGFQPRRTMAVWTRYMSQILAQCDRPTLVLDYDQLLLDPAKTVRLIAEFIDAPLRNEGALASTLEAGLRRSRPLPGAALADYDELYEVFHDLAGAHGGPVPSGLAFPEPAWVSEYCYELTALYAQQRAGVEHAEAATLRPALEARLRDQDEKLVDLLEERDRALALVTSLTDQLHEALHRADSTQVSLEQTNEERDHARRQLAELEDKLGEEVERSHMLQQLAEQTATDLAELAVQREQDLADLAAKSAGELAQITMQREGELASQQLTWRRREEELLARLERLPELEAEVRDLQVAHDTAIASHRQQEEHWLEARTLWEQREADLAEQLQDTARDLSTRLTAEAARADELSRALAAARQEIGAQQDALVTAQARRDDERAAADALRARLVELDQAAAADREEVVRLSGLSRLQFDQLATVTAELDGLRRSRLALEASQRAAESRADEMLNNLTGSQTALSQQRRQIEELAQQYHRAAAELRGTRLEVAVLHRMVDVASDLVEDAAARESALMGSRSVRLGMKFRRSRRAAPRQDSSS